MNRTLLLLKTLVLGPHPLKTKLNATRSLVEQDYLDISAATHLLKHTAHSKLTSPWALAGFCAGGFAMGLLSRRQLSPGPLVGFALRQSLWPLIGSGVALVREQFGGSGDADIDLAAATAGAAVAASGNAASDFEIP